MRQVRRSLAIAAAALVLTSGAALAASPYPPPSQGSGQVNPSRIRPGECATFSGNGFRPHVTVAISDNGASRGTATSDSSGAFAKQLCYGSDTKPGRHDLAGTGTGQDGNTLTVTATLVIEGVRQSSQISGTNEGQAVSGSGSDGASAGGSDAAAGTGAPGSTTPGRAAKGPVLANTGPDGATAPTTALSVGNTTTASPSTGDNSGLVSLTTVLGGVGALFLIALVLLFLARRRRRDEPTAA